MEITHLRRSPRPQLTRVAARLRQTLDGALTPVEGARASGYRWVLCAILMYQVGLSLWLGWPAADPSRWWDERFNVQNVESSLRAGRLSPANGYYGGASYAPQTVALALTAELHARTGWQVLRVLNPDRTLTVAGYHLLRGSQAICAALVVALTFALGLRLASPDVALVASALLATSPRLIHAGAIFKPDVELLAATLLALLTGWLAAARPPHVGRYLLAGVAIGLAAGAKLNGVTAAAPLVLATGIRWREVGRWPRLVLAGLASFATFSLFNPNLVQVARSLARNREHYSQTATGSWLEVLVETARFPFQPAFLGPLAGALAVAGLLLVGIWIAATKGHPTTRIGWWMLLSFPPIYYGVYVASSPRAKANHFLEILPFGALFAAVVVTSIGRAVLAVDSRPWRIALLALIATATIGVPAVATARQVYELTVPTTWDLARAWVERELPTPSHGYRILTLGGSLRGESPGAPAYERIAADAPAPGRVLAAADGVVASGDLMETLPELSEWGGPQADWERFGPGLFHARGRPTVARLCPHAARSHPAAGRILFRADSTGGLSARLPSGLEPDSLLSVRLRLRLPSSAEGDMRLWVGDRMHDWIAGPASEADTFFLSDRFRAPPEGRLRVSFAGGAPQAVAKGELFVWGPKPDCTRIVALSSQFRYRARVTLTLSPAEVR